MGLEQFSIDLLIQNLNICSLGALKLKISMFEIMNASDLSLFSSSLAFQFEKRGFLLSQRFED